MVNKDQIKDLQEIAEQFFEGNSRMRDLFDAEINYARVSGTFHDIDLNLAMTREYILEIGRYEGFVNYPFVVNMVRKKRLKRYLDYLREWADRQTKEMAPLVEARYVAPPASPTGSAPELPPAKPKLMTALKPQPLISNRAALIKECKEIWPTIEADLNQAAYNGLTKFAAPAGGKRGWYIEKAKQWAASKGKLKISTTKIATNAFDYR